MSIIAMLTGAFEFINRVWGWVSGRAKKKLLNKREELEKESRRAQLDGELDTLRRVRGEIQELDRKLQSGNY